MGTAPSRFVTNIPNDFICPECMGVFEKPEMGSCGHILCSRCWIGNERHSISDFSIISKIFCPVCQRYMQLREFHRIALKEMEYHISKMLVRCTHQGCKTVVRLTDFEKHVDDVHSGWIHGNCDPSLKSYFEYKYK